METKCPDCGTEFFSQERYDYCPECSRLCKVVPYQRPPIAPMFRYHCPKCGGENFAPADKAGRLTTCGLCDAEHQIPQAPQGIDNDGCPIETAKLLLLLIIIATVLIGFM